MNSSNRKQTYRRNEKLELLLSEINQILAPAEKKIVQNYRMPSFPVVFIVGCGRASTTLMLQWLAGTGRFGYPTNLLSRFYAAPYIGAKIQRLLTDPEFKFRHELADLSQEINYTSDLGKTSGALAPNEFWYFWRRFFPYGEIQYLTDSQLATVDSKQFVSELAAIEGAFAKPFALKAMIINFNIPYISRILEKVLFIHIVREPIYNIQSLLESREKFFGSTDHWYSFKPVEYPSLIDLDPNSQVAGQVYFTNCNINKGLRQIEQNRKLTVHYEEFCKNPIHVFNAIKRKFADQSVDVDWSYQGPTAFECRNRLRMSKKDAKKIMSAYKQFAKKGNL